MATGSGKTLLAIVLSYRLLKFAGAKRVLFLVDRGNLGRQTLKEFQQYVSPYNNFKFSEEYIVQRLTQTPSTPRRGFASAPSSGSIPCSRERTSPKRTKKHPSRD
jgi:type I site-specific restriction endonuclease